MCVRLFLCCSSARTRFPLHSHTHVCSHENARSRKTPKFFNTKREIVVGEFSFKSSPQQPQLRNPCSGSLFRILSGPFFLQILLNFPVFFLPTNRPVLWWCCVQSGSKPRRHTNYGGHERTDSLGFGLRCYCCWHWPNGRLGPARRSAYE